MELKSLTNFKDKLQLDVLLEILNSEMGFYEISLLYYIRIASELIQNVTVFHSWSSS